MSMNEEQEEFMEEVIEEMTERIETKFPKGVEKYGTILHKDHSVKFLHEMMMDELTDMPTYAIAKEHRIEEVRAILDNDDLSAEEKVKLAKEILG